MRGAAQEALPTWQRIAVVMELDHDNDAVGARGTPDPAWLGTTTRRRLLAGAFGLLGGWGAAGVAAAAGVPRRTLGRTNVAVSCLGLGMGGSFLRRVASETDAARLLHRALDLGITFWDTGASYGQGRRGERLLAPVLRERRSEVFLATKSGARDYDGTLRSAQESLAALGVEQIDLLQI
ncbi:MAG: aldo/keto reductase, partial [Armatimonadota bacterium]|nr:aldo/keto reductase [Armatimonadota bacterium]